MTDRQALYDRRATSRLRETDRAYQRLLRAHYQFLVPAGGRVLELGCSLGDLLASVRPSRGLGVDFSSAIIELARQRHPQLDFRAGNADEFTSPDQFDYLLLAD